MKVIDYKDFERVSRLFRGKFGKRLADFTMKLLAIDRVNQVYDHSYDYKGVEFASRLLDDLKVNYLIGNAERLNTLPDGAFITVSNHPYGGLDGIITIELIGRLRPYFRFMVNEFIAKVKTMEENFITVLPVTDRKNSLTAVNIRAIRETILHLRKGDPAGFFPSGAVSNFRFRDFRIRDREWQESILHQIWSAKLPVLPIRFYGRNSLFFYFLGLISWKIRSLRLPYEVFNKKGNKVRIGIGRLITSEELQHFPDYKSFGSFLRKSVYEMPVPETFVQRKPAGNGQ